MPSPVGEIVWSEGRDETFLIFGGGAGGLWLRERLLSPGLAMLTKLHDAQTWREIILSIDPHHNTATTQIRVCECGTHIIPLGPCEDQ